MKRKMKILIASHLLCVAMIVNGCAMTKPENGNESKVESQEDSNSGKVILTYATVGIDPIIEQYVYDYNQKQDSIYVQVEDYAKKYDNTLDAIQHLKLSLVTGDAPDLCDVTFIDLQQFVNKGAFEDLSPYFERDFQKEDYLWNAMKIGTVDDGLYSICPTFSLVTCATKLENCEKYGEEVTIDEWKEMILNRPEDCELLYNMTKVDLIENIFSYDVDEWIDWKNGTCHFDSDGWKDMLEIADQLPLKIEEYYFEGDCESEISGIREGTLFMTYEEIESIEDFQSMHCKFGDSYRVIGFPVNGICQTILETEAKAVAITKATNHKEEAWNFVKGFLSYEYQKKCVENEMGFPMLASVMDESLAEASKDIYVTDEEGVKVKQPRIQLGAYGEVKAYALTKEESDMLLNLIDTAVYQENKNDSVREIICEEASSYFAGDKSMNEITHNIQSRVSIFMDEQM